ncbi:hypothetical protein [Herbaspirillum sp. SJZ107]|uniref:hypothetical protein n=1 Tax=Herbaspirillum sp. SJZ107 TaxID=2572881 RepID=UPI00114D9DB3|nr:hypothetical protein [Herbaspirillum sp. SJZ107]
MRQTGMAMMGSAQHAGEDRAVKVDLLLRLEQEMRIVYLDSYVHADCNYVMNDNRQSMAILTRYLLGRGHRPAYLGAPPVAHPPPEERLAGYLETTAEAGMAPHLVPAST